tara:strand:+ start:422 stop:592 length:171 start_codon:yes stop_codon:yes gene_type:complete
MSVEIAFGWMIIVILTTAGLFYSLGLNSGRKDGYLKGRANGVRIGERRAAERQVSQ